MIRFTIRLLGRSMRWVAPAIVYLLWVGLILANPGPASSNAVAALPVHAMVLCWLSVVIGNIDDTGHRELCTALIGSPSRLLLTRAASAVVVALVASTVAAAALMVFSVPRSVSVGGSAAVFALELAGCIVGVGIGSALHRPMVRHVGLTVVGAVAALLACLAVPPVTHLLREIDAGDTGASYLLLASASVAAAALAGSAALLTRRFAR